MLFSANQPERTFLIQLENLDMESVFYDKRNIVNFVREYSYIPLTIRDLH